MKTVHLVYPHGDRISSPHSVGRKLAEYLRSDYRVLLYDVAGSTTIDPRADDVLIGHPFAGPWTTFRQSLRKSGWRRVLMLMPYNHGDNRHVAFADPLIRKCDLYLAITGRTWFESVPDSLFAHWRPKMVHVDFAVDRSDFPMIKHQFNEPGVRRFLYIGHTGWFKNTPYLSEIARRMPEAEFAWMGGQHWLGIGEEGIPDLEPLGRLDFSTGSARDRVAQYDFMVTVGTSDCNPATILESMSWGLIPVCTPESGYEGYPGIANVPLGAADHTVGILRELQELPEERLREMQVANHEILNSHFNWERFAGQVVGAIESDDSPDCLPVPFTRTLKIRGIGLRSHHSSLRPGNVKPAIRALMSSTRMGRAALSVRRRRWAQRQPEKRETL